MTTTYDIPPEALSLGTPISVHPVDNKKQRTNFITAGFMVLMGMGCMGIGVIGGIAERNWSLLGLMSLMGFFFGGMGAWMVYSGFNQRDWRVFLFKDGLSHTKQGKTTVIHWNEAVAVWQNITKHYRNGVYTGTTYHYTLTATDNRKLTFNNDLTEIEKLGQAIQNEVFNALFPKYVASYNNGQTLQFGKLSISKAGISNGKEMIPWPEVKGVSLDRGIINVKKEGKWLTWSSVTVGQTPNIFIFTSIVDQIVGINAPKK